MAAYGVTPWRGVLGQGVALADLADDPVVRLPRTMVAAVLDGPARRERHARVAHAARVGRS